MNNRDLQLRELIAVMIGIIGDGDANVAASRSSGGVSNDWLVEWAMYLGDITHEEVARGYQAYIERRKAKKEAE